MLDRMKWHKSVTDGRVIEAARGGLNDMDYPGFCLACGHKQGGVEPDARRYACESCGERQVYGAEELMLSLDWDDGGPASPAALWPAGVNGDDDE
jgi:hypothetical protein